MPTIRLIPLTSIGLYLLSIVLNTSLNDVDNNQWKHLLINYVETPALIIATIFGYLTIVLLIFKRLKLSIDVGISILFTFVYSAFYGHLIFIVYKIAN